MKYSPISDWGRDSQVVSAWNWPKPPWLTWTVTSASSLFWQWAWGTALHRSIELIVPAVTPATLKSAPVTSPNALSSSIL